MVTIEQLNEPVDIDRLVSQDFGVDRFRISKAGLAFFILDIDDRILALTHEGTSSFPPGSLGLLFEKLRRVEGRIEGKSESRIGGFYRGTGEELKKTEEELAQLGVYAARDSVIAPGFIDLGAGTEGVHEIIVGESIILRTDNPDAFKMADRSEEIWEANFMSLDDILAHPLPRPELHPIIEIARPHIPRAGNRDTTELFRLQVPSMPKTGPDYVDL